MALMTAGRPDLFRCIVVSAALAIVSSPAVRAGKASSLF